MNVFAFTYCGSNVVNLGLYVSTGSSAWPPPKGKKPVDFAMKQSQFVANEA